MARSTAAFPAKAPAAGPVPGASSVHDCILDAIAASRVLVGGYKRYGVEGTLRFVYLGSTDGLWYYTQKFRADASDDALRRSRCAAIVDATGAPSSDLGLECVEESLVMTCEPPHASR